LGSPKGEHSESIYCIELEDKIGLSDRKTKFGGGKRETPLHG
jgi:hypothetical protein